MESSSENPEDSDIRENKFTPLPKQESFIRADDNMVMLSGGFGTGKCTRKDTRIRLANGKHKEIKDINPGEKVLSLNTDTFKFESNKVLDKMDTGTKDGYKITLQGGKEVFCSKDHPFFAVSKKERKTNSPYHPDNKKRTVPTKYKWKIAENIQKQDLLAVPKTNTTVDIESKYPPEDYYLLGLILGDGAITHGVEYSTADSEVVNKIKNILRDPVTLNKYNGREYAYSITTGVNGGYIEDRPVNYVLEMLRDFNLIGCNSHTKFIPDSIYELGEHIISNVLSGLVVTDGWIDGQCLGYSSVSKYLARGVHELFSLIGIDSRFKKGRVKYKGEYRDTYRVEISRGIDLNLCASKLDILHKQEKLEELARSKSTTNLRGANKRYYIDEVAFHRVKSIESVSNIETYDLEVEGNHNYIGNGIVMHNSRSGCEKGYFLNMQYPGNRGLIVRKHFSDVKASTIKQTLLEEVIPESHIVKHNKTDHIIKHLTGEEDPTGEPVCSEIHYHGLDSGRNTSSDDLPRKIGSMAYGWIFVDEGSELSLGEWTQLQGRLRYRGTDQGGMHYPVPFRQIFTATNPDAPTHWMYDLFYNQNQGKVIEMSVDDNKYLAEDYVENMRNQFSGTYYERYFLGKWVGADGMVYENWDHDFHLRDWYDLPGNWEKVGEHNWKDEGKGVWAKPPEGWQIYRSIDFGYNNPAVVQWWARSPDDVLILFRELYKTETLVEDIAKDIKSNDPEEFNIERTFADHNAEDSATLQRYGVDVAKAKKDVQQGIQAVMARLRKDERDKSRLYVMRNARIHAPDKKLNDNNKPTCTAEEIPIYTWKDEGEEKPEKSNDHGCDAMRYCVYSIDSGNTPSQKEMETWTQIINEGW